MKINSNKINLKYFANAKHTIIFTIATMILFCSLSAKDVIVNGTFPEIEYLDKKLNSKSDKEFLNFNEGFWYKFNNLDKTDNRAFEFHPQESAYISLNSVPDQYALLQNNRLGLNFYEDGQTVIEPTMKSIAKDYVSVSCLGDFLGYLGQRLEVDSTILEKVNALPLVKISQDEKSLVAKGLNLMQKAEKSIDPEFLKSTNPKYEFEIDVSLKKDFAVELIKGFMIMVHFKNTQGFLNPQNFIQQLTQEQIDGSTAIAEAIYDDLSVNSIQSVLLDQIIDHVKYFHKKGFIWFYFQNRNFLGTWLGANTKQTLRALNDNILNDKFFHPPAFDTDIYFNLRVEEKDELEQPAMTGEEAIPYRRAQIGKKIKNLYVNYLDLIIQNVNSVSEQDKDQLLLLDSETEDDVFEVSMRYVPDRFKKHAFGPFANEVITYIITKSGIIENVTSSTMEDLETANLLKKILFLNGEIPYDNSLEESVEVHDVKFFLPLNLRLMI